MRFMAWCSDHGETENDAREVHQEDARSAAAFYANYYLWNSGDPFEEVCVDVAACSSHRLYRVIVTVRAEPVFEPGAAIEVKAETRDGREQEGGRE